MTSGETKFDRFADAAKALFSRSWIFQGWRSVVVAILAPGFMFGIPVLAQDAPQPVEIIQSDAEADAAPPDFDAEDLSDIDLLEIEVPTVITAGRRAQKITNVPYAVSVITSEDIRQSGARSVPDALRLAAGVDVADLSYGNHAVSPRGFQGFLSNHVLVLVDGRQIFDSLFGGTLWGSWPFQLEDIDHIEVVRGPGGVTWGANAVNGVINIITKDPADQLGFKLTTAAGSRGFIREHLGYAFQEDKLRMRISGEYEGSDGYRKGGSILRKLDDEYKAGRMNVHAIYDAGPQDTFTLSGGSSVVDGLYPPTPQAGFGLRRNSESQANFLLTKWNHQIEEGNAFELTAYVNDFHASPGVPTIDYRYQQLALQLSHSFELAETHNITWGIDNRVDLLDATNSDPFLLSKSFVASSITGLYLQDEWRFAPKWALTVGGRIDYESYGGFQPSARASLSYELNENAVLYAAVSRAFQMAPAALRFLDMPLLNGIARVTGERDVNAQTLIAYELGYRGWLFEKLQAGVNLFWMQYDDVTGLSTTLGPPTLLHTEFTNYGRASLYGAEVDLQYKATDKLTLLGNYTYQQLNWNASTGFVESDLISPPKHKFMLGARYDLTDDFRTSAHLYYVDATKSPDPSNPFFPRHNDPYFRLDLRAEHDLWDDRSVLAVGVRNLLDKSHSEGSSQFINNAETERMIYAEFSISFK
jgi:iron complex outermembrane receptor protein